MISNKIDTDHSFLKNMAEIFDMHHIEDRASRLQETWTKDAITDVLCWLFPDAKILRVKSKRSNFT